MFRKLVLSQDGTYPGVVIDDTQSMYRVKWYKWGYDKLTDNLSEWTFITNEDEGELNLADPAEIEKKFGDLPGDFYVWKKVMILPSMFGGYIDRRYLAKDIAGNIIEAPWDTPVELRRLKLKHVKRTGWQVSRDGELELPQQFFLNTDEEIETTIPMGSWLYEYDETVYEYSSEQYQLDWHPVVIISNPFTPEPLQITKPFTVTRAYLAESPDGILMTGWNVPENERRYPKTQLVGWRPERDVPFELPVKFYRNGDPRVSTLIPHGAWVFSYDEELYWRYKKLANKLENLYQDIDKNPLDITWE